MPIFDTFPRASFGGIEFPIEECSVRGGLRDHVHEYPHSPGGAPEKLGRKLYTVTMKGNFQNTFRKWEDLYPDALANLFKLFEDGNTADLVIPAVGTIKAYATDWDRSMTAKIRSGEKADFTFREDQPGAHLIDALVFTSTTLTNSADAVLNLSDELVPKSSLFDSLKAAVDSFAAIKDQAQLYQSLVEARLLAIAGLCQEIDATIQVPDDLNARILDALHQLYASTLTLLEDLHAKDIPLVDYIVPATMAVGTVAIAIYADASRGGEILSLNPIDDAFAIPAGTKLRVYAKVA